ncbi:MAG: cation-translocating P-type ATPase C-terminal domain-containing protein [Balneolaceae bacterium]|nr:cation-translocating P-type ATPase C-terminal domain-containing protein [Balneolaceae bacterium]
MPPRDPKEPILDNRHWTGIAVYGGIIMSSVLGSLWVAMQVLELESNAAVSISFLTLALAQLWHVFNMRSSSSFMFNNTIIRNRWIWAAIVTCIVLLLMAVYVPSFAAVLKIQPPSLYGWLTVLGFSLIPLLIGQMGLFIRKLKSPD